MPHYGADFKGERGQFVGQFRNLLRLACELVKDLNAMQLGAG
jgi:hypothetical protein